MTIAEKIRQSTDEELAALLVKIHQLWLEDEVDNETQITPGLARVCLQRTWKGATGAESEAV